MRTVIITPPSCRAIAQNLSTQILAVRGFDLPEQTPLDGALTVIRSRTPDLVIVILAATQDQDLEYLRRVREAGAWHLLTVGPATDAKFILKAMQAGSEVYLDQTELSSELRSALYRVHLRQTNPDDPGRLLAVISASGGCGGSTLSINLATAIASDRGSCNLIDLNLRKADLAPLLDLTPAYTIADLCRNGERLDARLYEKLLTRHSSGVSLLSAPLELHDIADTSPEMIVRAIDVARETFTNLVIDVEDSIHDEQIQTLGKASRILLVIRLDFVAIRHARRILKHLDAAGIARDRVEIVVNQFREQDNLPVPEAEATLGMKLSHMIPYDAAVIGASCNLGIPAVISHPDTPVVQSMLKLLGLDKPTPKSPPWSERARNWLWTGQTAAITRWKKIAAAVGRLRHRAPVSAEKA